MPALAVADASPSFPAASARTFSISELAQEFDLTTRAIRFYEDSGLLTPQRMGHNQRTRVYSARDRTRLKLTLRGKRLGLTLAEVKELVDMYESPRDTHAQLIKFLAVLGAHRVELEQRMNDLHATLDEVRMQEKQALRLLKPTAAKRPKNSLNLNVA